MVTATLSDIDGDYRGKKVLVTGAFGFVGSHLCKRLVHARAQVTAADINVCEDRASLINDEQLRSRVDVVAVDMASVASVRELVTGRPFDVIFHLAACSVVEQAAERPYDAIQLNTMGLVHLLEMLRITGQDSGARLPTLVLSSTDKVYGDLNGNPSCNEQSPLQGLGVYDAAKLAADVFAQAYHRAFRYPAVVIRLCNVFGPCDFNTDYRVIPRALRRLFERPEPKPPILYANAVEHQRDYLYIDDAATALLMVGANPACQGEVFNVSAACCWKTPDLLNEVVNCAARLEERFDQDRAMLIRQNSLTIYPENPAVIAIKRQHLDGGKIEQATGFRPAVTFAEGLDRTVEYYRDYFSRRW